MSAAIRRLVVAVIIPSIFLGIIIGTHWMELNS